MTYAQGALLEPLSVVMHGIEVGGLSLGQGVVVCGAGPIGLIALAAARASGAFPLVITDLDSRRLAFAKQFVPACETYLIQRALGPQENAQAIRALFGAIEDESRAPKSVLECTGVESSIVTGAYTARRGGTVTVIGVGRPIVHNLPFMHMSLAEVSSPATPFSKILTQRKRTLTISRSTSCLSIDTRTLGRPQYRPCVVACSTWTRWLRISSLCTGQLRRSNCARIFRKAVSKCMLWMGKIKLPGVLICLRMRTLLVSEIRRCENVAVRLAAPRVG